MLKGRHLCFPKSLKTAAVVSGAAVNAFPVNSTISKKGKMHRDQDSAIQEIASHHHRIRNNKMTKYNIDEDLKENRSFDKAHFSLYNYTTYNNA